MNSVEFLTSIFQFIKDLKMTRIVKLEDREIYSIMMIVDLEGDDEDEQKR